MEEKKKDTIDRHSKKRAILIEDRLLLSQSSQDYINEIIDINEISEYYDTIILADDVMFVKAYLEHYGLKSIVTKKYENCSKLRTKYRFLVMMCMKKELKKLQSFYQCDVLSK